MFSSDTSKSVNRVAVAFLSITSLVVLVAAASRALAQTERPNRKELIDASLPEMAFGSQLRYLSGAGTLTSCWILLAILAISDSISRSRSV